MNREIIIEDWVLTKEYIPAIISTHDGYGGTTKIGDFKHSAKSFRIIGTPEQIKACDDANDMAVDDVYTYEPIKKGSYWDGIVCGKRADRPTLEEYNKKFDLDYLKYLKMYKDNFSKLLILRTS